MKDTETERDLRGDRDSRSFDARQTEEGESFSVLVSESRPFLVIVLMHMLSD